MARVVQSVMDFMYPYTNCMLALTSLGFAASLPDVVRNQDKLAPLLLRNAPAAATCFALNAVLWQGLGHFFEKNGPGGTNILGAPTAPICEAACVAQRATSSVLSLAPLSCFFWNRISGGLFCENA
ncbi:hypothetical protein ABBQ38_010759 [Trebouxia sp. C0009 RCD-2024]